VLRSILRQDPDVVLIGEIRDQETAEIAIQASLTGHLVLSTLHTNSAPSTITRLTDMGVDLPALGSALRGVIAQRLLRRLCLECRAPGRSKGSPPPSASCCAAGRTWSCSTQSVVTPATEPAITEGSWSRRSWSSRPRSKTRSRHASDRRTSNGSASRRG
jgi:type II secretory ATPase GspE/PulE/Tfp pilus assembly ATPase PilB-like protein